MQKKAAADSKAKNEESKDTAAVKESVTGSATGSATGQAKQPTKELAKEPAKELNPALPLISNPKAD